MKIWKDLRRKYIKSNLATKIRYFYIVLLIPLVIITATSLYRMWAANHEYEEMIASAAMASEFSLDFKQEFDYEMYRHVINKADTESTSAYKLLAEAESIVNDLDKVTKSPANLVRLGSIKNSLQELRGYTDRIIANRKNLEDSYNENMKLWEYDVKLTTSLIKEGITQFTYYEIKEIQKRRVNFQNSFIDAIRYSIIAFVIITVVLLYLSYSIPKSITKPVRELVEVTNKIAAGDLTAHSDVEGGDEVTILSDSMNLMIAKMKQLLEQTKLEQKQLRNAEFRILQAQINPHFLYNTLDAIVWLAEAGEQEKVVRMVGSLSDFFRTSLNQGKDIITLREELQHVKSYLEIQKMRYQDIFDYELSVSENYNFNPIPKISLQPLIENALYHGIKNKRGGGTIKVGAFTEGDALVIRVEDTGIGIKPERLQEVIDGITNNVPSEKNIYGLYNVNERIKLNFGNEFGLRLQSVYGEGTKADVLLPLFSSSGEVYLPEDLLS